MKKIQRLFVYGTLAPGKPNQHILADIDGQWQKATVLGDLYEEGWGASMGFPGIKLSEQGAKVQGLIFSAPDLDSHWAKLDAFEGAAYERILTMAELPDQSRLSTYIYALRKESGSHKSS